jgi:hypothetical protein
MSISMDRFGLNEEPPEPRLSDRNNCPIRLECPACGFEPEDPVTAPRRCPKCAGSAWRRFVLPGSLLSFADQQRLNSGVAEVDEEDDEL